MSALSSAIRWLAHRPRLTAFLGAVCVAASGVLYRLAEVTPETASFFRAFYGLPLLVVVAWWTRRRVGPLPMRGKWLAAIAGVLFAIDLLSWHHAIDQVGAGLATVLGNLQVVVVAIAAWLLFGERPSGRTLVALPIILFGVVLISGVIGSNNYGLNPPLGVALGIVTALTYGGYLLIIRPLGRGRTAEPVAIGTASTAVFCLVVGLAIGRLDLVPTLPEHFWLVLLGLSAQSAGYLLITFSLPRLPAVVTSIILLAQPVMSVLLAMWLVAETPSVAQLAGVGLLIGGIALATVPLRGLRRRVLPATP